MKKNNVMTKQSALTGLLLLVLAANVSWNHFIDHGPSPYGSEDIASETPSGSTSLLGLIGLSDSKPQPEPVEKIKVISIPDGCERKEGASVSYTCTRRICDRDYSITFLTVKEGDKVVSTITNYRKDSAAPESFEGGLTQRDMDADAAIKTNALANMIEQIKTNNCADKHEQDKKKSVAEEKEKKNEEKKATEAEKRKQWQGERDCELGASGEALDDLETLKCQTRRLGKVESESDYDGKRIKRSKSELQILVNNLNLKVKKGIKKLLLSKDDSKREEGADLATQAKDAIQALDSDLLDSRKREKMALEYDAMRFGGETYAKTSELKDEAKSIEEDMRTNYMDRQTDPGNPYLVQEWGQLLAQHQALSQRLQWDAGRPYQMLEAYRSSNLIGSEDFRDFANPYLNLRRSLLNSIDPSRAGTGLSDLDSGFYPSDLGARRGLSDLNQGRQYGAILPSLRPNIALSGRSSLTSSPLSISSRSFMDRGGLLPTNDYQPLGGGSLLPQRSIYDRTLPNNSLNNPFGLSGGGAS